MSAPPLSARAWLDDFFAAYYRRRPVNATFIGVHEYDDQLARFLRAGVAATVAEMASLLRALRGGAVAAADERGRGASTARLAEHFLMIQSWEFASRHFQRGNPCVYTGEAIFGVLSLFLRPFAPLARARRGGNRPHGGDPGVPCQRGGEYPIRAARVDGAGNPRMHGRDALPRQRHRYAHRQTKGSLIRASATPRRRARAAFADYQAFLRLHRARPPDRRLRLRRRGVRDVSAPRP